MEIASWAATDIGLVKEQNEDQFLCDKGLQLYVVCDGLGGHAAGEYASAYCIKTVREYVAAHYSEILACGDDQDGRKLCRGHLDRAVRVACAEIFDHARVTPEHRGMGTTVVLVLFVRDRAYVAHVGDSRLYLKRGEQLHQITQDHSLINELIKSGRLTQEEAATVPQKNVMTRAVGVYEEVTVDTFDLQIGHNDTFLLCSDGLSDYLESAEETVSLLSEKDLLNIPRQAIDLAISRGGKDNITALVVRCATSKSGEEDEITQNIAALRRLPLFQHLTYMELVEVLNTTEVHRLAQGTVVIQQAEMGSAMYIIIRGSVDVLKDGNKIATLKDGAHFGEMSLIDNQPRSATVVVADPVRLLELNRNAFFTIIKQNKEIAVKLLWCLTKVLNDRLRETSKELTDAKGKAQTLQNIIAERSDAPGNILKDVSLPPLPDFTVLPTGESTRPGPPPVRKKAGFPQVKLPMLETIKTSLQQLEAMEITESEFQEANDSTVPAGSNPKPGTATPLDSETEDGREDTGEMMPFVDAPTGAAIPIPGKDAEK